MAAYFQYMGNRIGDDTESQKTEQEQNTGDKGTSRGKK